MPTLMMLILLRIKSEMDDFRDNLSDLGRDDDLRWMITLIVFLVMLMILKSMVFHGDKIELENI